MLACVALLAVACSPVATNSDDPDTLRVVTTTGILADLVRNVTGARAQVISLVPENVDPHGYEPSLRNVRDVVYADVAFSNYLLLEQHSIIRMLDANLPDGVPNISLAESAVTYAARIIPLVENVNLDTIWLGLAVHGSGTGHGASRSSQVRLVATGMDGPGQLTGYLTETFGRPRIYFDSADGLDPDADGVLLPTDAHTHMSWTFSDPGVYRLDLAAELLVDPDTDPIPMGETTVTFAVGIDPHTVPGAERMTILDGGHADVAVNLDTARVELAADDHADGHAHRHRLDPDATIVEVPNKALAPIPASPEFRFLGRPASLIFQLPQAVLGRHVHGEIDPHLWHDVRNAVAYVQIIRDTLSEVDPAGAEVYRTNAAAYLDVLYELDAHVADTLAAIPPARRHLITTHDAFGYLAAAYDLRIAGFVTPNPATEPSLAERRRLSETIRNLQVPAVFLEPALAQRSSVLGEVAAQHDLDVCPIHGDAFAPGVETYVELMRANADSLHRCLADRPPPEPSR